MDGRDSISTPIVTARIDVDLLGTPTDHTKYLRMIKGLMYLTASRPDIAFAIFDSGFELIAYSDTDNAGCHDDCKSTSKGIQFSRDRLVSWSSKKQDYTAMSTVEKPMVPGVCWEVMEDCGGSSGSGGEGQKSREMMVQVLAGK
nr:hypothetical protein [Tanacetum cinerariifolium]